MSDLGLLRPAMQRWPEHDGWARRVHRWLDANRAFQRYLLAELDRSGPMLLPIGGPLHRTVAVDGLDRQPQRLPDAGVPRCQR